MAPEVIREQGSATISWRKADVWSLACTTLEMTTGKPPWSQFQNSVTILYHIACQETLPEYPNPASIELITFLNVCLQRHPAKRPDITSLLLHPFVASMGANGWNTANMGFVQRPSTVSTTPAGEWDNCSVGSYRSGAGENTGCIGTHLRSSGGANNGGRNRGDSGVFPPDRKSSSSEQVSTAGPRLFAGRLDPDVDVDIDLENDNDDYTSPPTYCEGGGVKSGGGSRIAGDLTEPEISHPVPIYATQNLTSREIRPDYLAGGRPRDEDIDSLASETSDALDRSQLHDYRHDEPRERKDDLEIAGLPISQASSNQASSAGLHQPAPKQTSTSILGKFRKGNLKKNLSPKASSGGPSQLQQQQNYPVAESGYPADSENGGLVSDSETTSLSSVSKKKGRSIIRITSANKRGSSMGQHGAVGPADNRQGSKQRQLVSIRHHGQPSHGGVESEKNPIKPLSDTIPGCVLHSSQPRDHLNSDQADVYYDSDEALVEELRLHASPAFLSPPPSQNWTRNEGNYDDKSETGYGAHSYPSDYRGYGSENLPSTDNMPTLLTPRRYLSSNPSPNFGNGSIGGESGVSPALSVANGETDSGFVNTRTGLGTLNLYSNLDPGPTIPFPSNTMAPITGSPKVVRPLSERPVLHKTLELSRPAPLDLNKDASSWNGEYSPTGPSSPASPMARKGAFQSTRSPYPAQFSLGKPLSPVMAPPSPVTGISMGIVRNTGRGDRSLLTHTSSMSALPSQNGGPLSSDSVVSMAFGVGGSEPSMQIATGMRIKGAVGHTRELSARNLRKGAAGQGSNFDNNGNFDSRDLLHIGPTLIQQHQGPERFVTEQSFDQLRVSGVANSISNSAGDIMTQPRQDSELSMCRKLSAQRRTNITPTMSSTPFTPLSISTPLSSSGLEDNEFDRSNDEYVEDVTPSMFQAPALSLDEHTGAITRLRVPRRTSLLLSASIDGTLRIWGPGETESRAVLDASSFMLSGQDNQRERKISLGTKNDENTISSLESPGGGVKVKIMNMWAQEGCETIWCAANDCALRVWSGAEGKALRFLKGHEDAVTVMEGMSGIGGLQASCLVGTGSADRTVRIWDARAKRAQIFIFKGHSDTVLAMRWGEGGRSVMSSGKDKTIRIWDTRTGRSVANYKFTFILSIFLVEKYKFLMQNFNL